MWQLFRIIFSALLVFARLTMKQVGTSDNASGFVSGRYSVRILAQTILSMVSHGIVP
jgi:hypothetical protein